MKLNNPIALISKNQNLYLNLKTQLKKEKLKIHQKFKKVREMKS